MQLQPVKHQQRNLLLQASSEEMAEGEWSASFAVFTDNSERLLVYWMPSLFETFATEHEAELAARSAGLHFIEHLD